MPHTILMPTVTSEELAFYSTYFEKHKAVGENIHSWLRIGLIANSSLLAIVAFLIRPVGAEVPLCVPQLGFQDLLPIAVISLSGFVFCRAWLKGYKNMCEWQLRTNAILASVEAQLLQARFLTPWQELVKRQQPEQSMDKCGMWNMINSFEPPLPARPRKDVVDIMKTLPGVFLFIWILLLIWVAYSMIV